MLDSVDHDFDFADALCELVDLSVFRSVHQAVDAPDVPFPITPTPEEASASAPAPANKVKRGDKAFARLVRAQRNRAHAKNSRARRAERLVFLQAEVAQARTAQAAADARLAELTTQYGAILEERALLWLVCAEANAASARRA